MSAVPESKDFRTDASLVQHDVDDHMYFRKTNIRCPVEENMDETSLSNRIDEELQKDLPKLFPDGDEIEDGEEKIDEDYDPEPKFKYERLLSDKNPDSAKILLRDSATALAVHSKFLALGTKNGEIHILDLQGNR